MAIPASELDKKFAAFRKQKSLQTSPGQALAAAVRSPREARRNISGGQNAMIELFEAAEVRKALSTMLEPRAVFEVRALDAQFKGERRKAIIAGYFDDPSICVLQLSRLQSATGIYVTMNPVNPALLSRCANRLDIAKRDALTGDHDIERRMWFLIDTDPKRPSGISATKAEKELARQKSREIYKFLKERGFPEPVIADSGNGYHLLYRVDLPSNDEKLLERVLAALADYFDGDGVTLDRSVFNPSRIAKLYGTRAAKGDNTKERPHRLSKILKAPEALEVVSTEQLQALVDELQPVVSANVERPEACNDAFDVEGFLARYGIAVAERITRPDGRIKWRLERCPFNPDHETPDAAVFQMPGGKLGFRCLHNSCSDKHWKDFRRLFEPEYDYGKAEHARVEVRPGVDSEPIELPPPPAPYVPPPLDLLPSVLQDYVHAAAESLNVDVAFILLPQLSSLGTGIGNSRSILLKPGFIQPPVLWTAIVGPSGSRKSPAIEAGCLSVMEHERELMRQNKEAAEIYADELSQWESKKGKGRGQKPEEPPFSTCTCDDLTIEALADILATNPRGILVRKDELSHWLASFDQYKPTKGSDVSRWLSLHTAVFLAVDRRTDSRHYRIENPRVSITGGIQPKILRRALTPEFFERGLPARFIFSYPPFRQDRWSEVTVPADLRARVLDLFSELWLLQPLRGNPQLLPLDRDAKAVFVDFYNECGEYAVEAGEHEGAAWGKLTGYGARLGLIGQLARDPKAKIVTGEVMKAACDLARWSGNEAVRIYAELAETPWQREARELCEFVERRGGTATLRDTITYYWPLKNQSEKAQQVFDQLVKSARGRWEDVKPSGRGRPTQIFRLLHTSASAKIPELRGKTANCADAEASSADKKVYWSEPDRAAVSDEFDDMPAGILEL